MALKGNKVSDRFEKHSRHAHTRKMCFAVFGSYRHLFLCVHVCGVKETPYFLVQIGTYILLPMNGNERTVHHVCVCGWVCLCMRLLAKYSVFPFCPPLLVVKSICLSATQHLPPVVLPITSNTCASVCACVCLCLLTFCQPLHPPVSLLCFLSVCPPVWSPLSLLCPSSSWTTGHQIIFFLALICRPWHQRCHGRFHLKTAFNPHWFTIIGHFCFSPLYLLTVTLLVCFFLIFKPVCGAAAEI